MKEKVLLWFKRRTKKDAAVAAIVAAIAIIVIIIVAIVRANSVQYFYIDLNGQTGVAEKCGVAEWGLYCDQKYGGKVAVRQYWKGE